jgi:hypothetical protein
MVTNKLREIVETMMILGEMISMLGPPSHEFREPGFIRLPTDERSSRLQDSFDLP